MGAPARRRSIALTDVRQRVSDRTLKQLLWARERSVGRQVVVEPAQRVEKTSNFGIPRERRRVAPHLGASGD
jgi:hypothetical protein